MKKYKIHTHSQALPSNRYPDAIAYIMLSCIITRLVTNLTIHTWKGFFSEQYSDSRTGWCCRIATKIHVAFNKEDIRSTGCNQLKSYLWNQEVIIGYRRNKYALENVRHALLLEHRGQNERHREKYTSSANILFSRYERMKLMKIHRENFTYRSLFGCLSIKPGC